MLVQVALKKVQVVALEEAQVQQVQLPLMVLWCAPLVFQDEVAQVQVHQSPHGLENHLHLEVQGQSEVHQLRLVQLMASSSHCVPQLTASPSPSQVGQQWAQEPAESPNPVDHPVASPSPHQDDRQCGVELMEVLEGLHHRHLHHRQEHHLACPLHHHPHHRCSGGSVFQGPGIG